MEESVSHLPFHSHHYCYYWSCCLMMERLGSLAKRRGSFVMSFLSAGMRKGCRWQTFRHQNHFPSCRRRWSAEEKCANLPTMCPFPRHQYLSYLLIQPSWAWKHCHLIIKNHLPVQPLPSVVTPALSAPPTVQTQQHSI